MLTKPARFPGLASNWKRVGKSDLLVLKCIIGFAPGIKDRFTLSHRLLYEEINCQNQKMKMMNVLFPVGN